MRSGRSVAHSELSRLGHLSAVGALAYCSYAMCRSPVLPLFARELGASPAAVGLIVAASTLTGVALKFPAGALSDVMGRRVLLLAGALAFALTPLGYLAIVAIPALAVVRVVHGTATAFFGPVASATLSDLAPVDQRGRWLSVYSAAQGTGQALGPIIAAALILGSDFSRVFVASAVLGGFALVLVLAWPPSGSRAPRHAMWTQLRDGARSVASDRRVLGTSLAQAGQFFVNGTLAAFLPLYAREILGFSPERIGWLFGLQTAAVLLSRPLFGALSDRVGRRPLIVTGLAICATCMMAIAHVHSFGPLLGVTLVYGVGLATTTSAASAYVTDLTRGARYGAAHGLFGTIYDVGDALGPVCAGVVVASAGYATAFQLAGGVAATIAVIFAWASRRWPEG
jgi:DHA1 family multidrug resistance protein-like MFS transporter